jgi:hypothetical protein
MSGVARTLAYIMISFIAALALLTFEIGASIFMSSTFSIGPYSFIGLRFFSMFAAGLLVGLGLLRLTSGRTVWVGLTALLTLAYYVLGLTRVYDTELAPENVLAMLITEPVTSIWGGLVLGLMLSARIFMSSRSTKRVAH